jgi:hypothetical protein
LRAEIEAQVAAHKVNISSIEAQAHAAWLNARQAERKLEESRMEATTLRRKLTSIAENPSAVQNDIASAMFGMNNSDLNTIPSPIRVESPNSSNNINNNINTNNSNINSIPNNMMPPPSMMMPPFLPHGAPPFLPPFLPPADHLPPNLGRLISPPPKRFTPIMRDRYSPRNDRGRRSFSPDSRYDDDYSVFDTETDYSPPPSPIPRRAAGGYVSPAERTKKPKGDK